MYLNEIKCRKVIDLELANERAFSYNFAKHTNKKNNKIKGSPFYGK